MANRPTTPPKAVAEAPKPPAERLKKIPINELQRRKLAAYDQAIKQINQEANSYLDGIFEDRNIDPVTVQKREINLDVGGYISYVNLPPAAKSKPSANGKGPSEPPDEDPPA